MLTIVDEHLDCFQFLPIVNKCYHEDSSTCLWLTYIHICVEHLSGMELLENRICICSALIDIGNQLSGVVTPAYTIIGAVAPYPLQHFVLLVFSILAF